MSGCLRESPGIALVCADASVRMSLQRLLRSYPLCITGYETLDRFYAHHRERPFDCLIFDQWLSGTTVLHVRSCMEKLKRVVGIVATHTREPELFNAFAGEDRPGICFLGELREAELLGAIANAVGWRYSPEQDSGLVDRSKRAAATAERLSRYGSPTKNQALPERSA